MAFQNILVPVDGSETSYVAVAKKAQNLQRHLTVKLPLFRF